MHGHNKRGDSLAGFTVKTIRTQPACYLQDAQTNINQLIQNFREGLARLSSHSSSEG